MTEAPEKTFRTKTGYCHILPDKIVLTRTGIRGGTAEVVSGNNIARLLIIYSALACFLVYFSWDFYSKGHYVQATLFALFVLYFIFVMLRSVNNSAAPVIERSRIKDVKFKKAIPGLTRSRFEVKFEDEKGRIKKRLIMLPGSLAEGEKETEIALKLMKEEKLLKSGSN